MGSNSLGFYSEKPVAIYHDDPSRITVYVGKLTYGENNGRLFYMIEQGPGTILNPGGTWEKLFPEEYSKRRSITVGEALKIAGESVSDKAAPGEWRLPPDAELQITATGIVIDPNIEWITNR